MVLTISDFIFLGLDLTMVGLCMTVVTRTRVFRASMATRRALIEQATLDGNTAQTAKWTAELRAWESRFPKYALGLVCAGPALAALGAVLLLLRGGQRF